MLPLLLRTLARVLSKGFLPGFFGQIEFFISKTRQDPISINSSGGSEDMHTVHTSG